MFYAEDAPSRPASRWDPAPVEETANRPQSFLDPAYLAGSVWKARRKILLLGVVGAVVAGAIAMSQPKQYTATAQIVLDPRELNLVQNEVTPTASGMATDATLALVESQIAVMTSNSVLLRVVRDANLTADTEFNGLRETWLGNLSATIAALMSDDPVSAADTRELRTVTNLWRHISAVRNANSFVINVSVTSEDAEKAAHLANLTTQTFIAEQGRAQSDLAKRATTSLSSRLAELRARVVEAEDAAEAYKAQNQLVGVGGRLIDDDYITRVNNQLADVRSQITALNVRARSLREASVEDIAAGSFPEGLNSEALLRLRQTYSEAAQNQAILASRLGPRHPQRIAADQAVATARRGIETELSRIVASAQTELARAQATERDLTTQIDTLRSRQIETSGAFVRLRELEREVDASRAVYEAYLLRARQTGEQESLNTTNVRVISDATVPFLPSSLSRKIVVILGFVGGIGLGIAISLLAAAVRALRGTAIPAAAAARPAREARPASGAVPAMPAMAAAPPAPPARSEDEAPAVAAVAPVQASVLAVGEGDWSLRGGSFEPAETSLPAEAVARHADLEETTDVRSVPAPVEPVLEEPAHAESDQAGPMAEEIAPVEPAGVEAPVGEPTAASETVPLVDETKAVEEPDAVAEEAKAEPVLDEPAHAESDQVESAGVEVPAAEPTAASETVSVAVETPTVEEPAAEVVAEEAKAEPAVAMPAAVEPVAEDEVVAAAPTVVEMAPVAAPPVEAASEDEALSEIEARREALRQRIRELGARRTIHAPPALDITSITLGDTGSAEERRERISLRLAAARNRRSALQGHGDDGEL